MEMGKMERRFQIDLRKIEGEGEFPCPVCGEIISPDDESCVTYDILEVRMSKDNNIDEIVIQCKICGSLIHLTGFNPNCSGDTTVVRTQREHALILPVEYVRH